MRKASGKTVKGKGTDQRKRRKVSSGRVSYEILSQDMISLFDEFIMYIFNDSTLKNSLIPDSLNDATQNNFQCKQNMQMFVI